MLVSQLGWGRKTQVRSFEKPCPEWSIHPRQTPPQVSHVQDAPTIQREPTGATSRLSQARVMGLQVSSLLHTFLMRDIRGTLTPSIRRVIRRGEFRAGVPWGPQESGRE